MLLLLLLLKVHKTTSKISQVLVFLVLNGLVMATERGWIRVELVVGYARIRIEDSSKTKAIGSAWRTLQSKHTNNNKAAVMKERKQQEVVETMVKGVIDCSGEEGRNEVVNKHPKGKE